MKLPLYSRFVGGYSVATVRDTLQECKALGMGTILDYVKESASDPQDTEKYVATLVKYAEMTQPSMVAIKCSAFHTEKEHHTFELTKHMARLGIPVHIDAETVDSYDDTAAMSMELMTKFNTGTPRVYKTYQMYRRDSLDELMKDIMFAKRRKFVLGAKVVRGAYHHQDSKTHPNVLYQNIHDTHGSYNAACRQIIYEMMRTQNLIAPVFATHNENSIHVIRKVAQSHFVSNSRFHFAQLYGMADHHAKVLVEKRYRVLKYVPFGRLHESVPYLLRRVYENPDILQYCRSFL